MRNIIIIWFNIFRGTLPRIWSDLDSITEGESWVLRSLPILRQWITALQGRVGDGHSIPSQGGRWMCCYRWISQPPLACYRQPTWRSLAAQHVLLCSWIDSRYPPLSQPLSDQRQTRHARNTQLSQGLCCFYIRHQPRGTRADYLQH